jgi:hypothetical protein
LVEAENAKQENQKNQTGKPVKTVNKLHPHRPSFHILLQHDMKINPTPPYLLGNLSGTMSPLNCA